jgi:hypothetical protein
MKDISHYNSKLSAVYSSLMYLILSSIPKGPISKYFIIPPVF